MAGGQDDDHAVTKDAQLEQRVAHAEAISRISASISRCLDMKRLIEEVVAGVKSLLEADGATVFLLDDDGSLLCTTADGGASDEVFGLRLSPGEGVAGWVARERRPVLITDAQKDSRLASWVDEQTGYETRTLVAAPLIVAGDLVGVLEVVNRAGGGSFTAGHLEVLETFAPHVAVAVSNARLTEKLRLRADNLESRLEKRVGQILLAKREWEATVDAFIDPILLVDSKRRVRRANTITARRAKIPIVSVPGKRCYEVAFGTSSPCDRCPLPDALEGRPASAELSIERSIHFASHFPVKDADQGVYAVACSYRDITATREMECRLKETERMASVGRLAAGIAHEINNPIAFMASNFRTLQLYFEDLLAAAWHGRSNGRQQPQGRSRDAAAKTLSEIDLLEIAEDGAAILGEIHEGTRRISKVVRELGAFAHDRRSVENIFKLGHCVERVVRQLEVEFPGASIEVQDNASGLVRGCPASFDQAVAAVVRNALQASPELVTIAVRDEQNQVVVLVEDRGPGIAEEIRGRIFEPFFTTREVGDGMGLGLSTVYTTVSRHGGSIGIEEPAGGGARVILRVPAVETCLERRRR